MFPDYTNLFISAKDFKELFGTMNKELKVIEHWFSANKLSLHASNTKYSFFLSYADKILLRLPELKINNILIKREESIKFLVVILNKNAA